MAVSASRSRLFRRAASLVAVIIAGGALALLPAVGASAHDYLVSSTPAAGSTETKAVTKVVLTFDDRVLDLAGDGSSNVVEVTGPEGKHFEAGCPTIADVDVSVPVRLGTSGEYTVRWQIVSADGHVVTNAIQFRYVKPASVVAAVGTGARPTCGDQPAGSGAPAKGASASASASGSSSPSSALPVALGVGGGIIVVALIAVAVILVRSGRGVAASAGSQRSPKASRQGSRWKPPPPPAD